MLSPSNIAATTNADEFSVGLRNETPNGVLNAEYDDRFFRELIEAACAAPSADNNQPWMFRPADCGIDIYCDLDRRLPSDVDGMFDLASLGAVIENICLKLDGASKRGRVSVADSPVNELDHLRYLARIDFTEDSKGGSENGLADFIPLRFTNRTHYSTASLPAEQLAQISSVAIADSSVCLHWENERSRIRKFASLIALSDSLRFQYRDFHEELHRQLRLTRRHAEQTRDGLDYRTLGLPPGGSWFLRMLRPWKTMEFLNQFGMARLLSLPSSRLVQNSGAIGFVFLKDRTPESMIAGGRALQRIWLQATKMNLAFQPLGSLPIFLANESMPTKLRPTMDRVRAKADELLPTSEGFLHMAFRVGNARHSSETRSMRRPAQQVTLPAIPKG